MKKKILLGVAVSTLVFAGGASAYFVANGDDKGNENKSARVENIKKEEPKKDVEEKPVENTETIATAQRQQTQTAQNTPSQPVAPTPEENKAKIMSVITEYVKSKGGSQSAVLAQTTCFDQIFAGSNMYSDYDNMLNFPLVQKYLTGQFAFDGAGTCKQVHRANPF